MDNKDKNVIEKVTDKINDAVENIVSTTADALDHATRTFEAKRGGNHVYALAGDGFVSDPLTPPLEIMPVMAPKKKPPAKKKSAAKKSEKNRPKRQLKDPQRKRNHQPDGKLRECTGLINAVEGRSIE